MIYDPPSCRQGFFPAFLVASLKGIVIPNAHFWCDESAVSRPITAVTAKY